MREWMITEPVFESDQINPALRTAYWEGHRDFAYDFLRFVHPKKMVELGSQYGCSLFCFCQSIKDFNLATEIHAIDRWAGDIGAVDDGETVYESVMKLPDDMRTVVILRYYEELSLKEIAEITNTNLNTVKYRLYAAQKRIEKMIKEEL